MCSSAMARWWIAVAATSLACLVAYSHACSCMYSHPQEHYCSADFVALVKVKRPGKGNNNVMSYQIRVKKEFRMTEKARQALSQGLVWTSAHESSCGVTLKNTRYLMAGRVTGQKVWIGTCNFVQEWSSLSRKQKKGFRRLYQEGCQCKVRTPGFMMPWTRGRHCMWTTVWEGAMDCQGLHSVCVPSINDRDSCTWVNNSAFKTCMRERQQKKQLEREREP